MGASESSHYSEQSNLFLSQFAKYTVMEASANSHGAIGNCINYSASTFSLERMCFLVKGALIFCWISQKRKVFGVGNFLI